MGAPQQLCSVNLGVSTLRQTAAHVIIWTMLALDSCSPLVLTQSRSFRWVGGGVGGGIAWDDGRSVGRFGNADLVI